MPQEKMGPKKYARLIKNLIPGEYNCRELAALTDLHYITVLEYINALKNEGLVHISRWDKDAVGRDALKVFKFGPGDDVKRNVIGRGEQQRRYRLRKAIREGRVVPGADQPEVLDTPQAAQQRSHTISWSLPGWRRVR